MGLVSTTKPQLCGRVIPVVVDAIPRVLCPCAAVPASAIIVDLNPFSENLVAKAHGRVDMVLVAMKSLWALLVSLRFVLTPATVLSVVAAGAVIQLYGCLTYMPYFNDKANQLQCGFAAAFVWACACTVLAEFRGQPQDEVEGYLFLFALPFVAHSGYTLAHRRLDGLKHGNSDGIANASACIVELRARQMLAAARGSDAQPGAGANGSSDKAASFAGSDKPNGGLSGSPSFRRDGSSGQAFPEVSSVCARLRVRAGLERGPLSTSKCRLHSKIQATSAS